MNINWEYRYSIDAGFFESKGVVQFNQLDDVDGGSIGIGQWVSFWSLRHVDRQVYKNVILMLFLLEPVSWVELMISLIVYFCENHNFNDVDPLTLFSNFRRNFFALACTNEASSKSFWDNVEKKNHLFTVDDNRFSTKVCYGYKKQLQTAFFRNQRSLRLRMCQDKEKYIVKNYTVTWLCF